MSKKMIFMLMPLLLFSCSQNNQSISGRMEMDTGKPALHAVRDQQLRELMDRMDGLLQERFMTEHELDLERRKYAQRIVETTGKLAETIDKIVGQLPVLALSQSEQTTFLALAQKLREQTFMLQAQAKQNHIDAIPESIQQLSVTCSSCHALFRKLDK